ncbi:hypothetical protein BN855_29830 [Salmonella enterica subsp. enterica serovar Bovismorbificans str. 3114]|nr:hypothetical protein BN855_29830 [Salmonella enterica subsp. enterica serovar Bovismorbificans str. 3114]
MPERRFIPAGAGNTLINTSWPWGLTVYPRWRGEHIRRHLKMDSLGGLSPLARGTL